MLNPVELNSLLGEGRTLQAEIGDFIKAATTVSSQRLIARIDKLIHNIKPQLLAPSYAENNELALLITILGRIAKNLNDIKNLIKPNLIRSTFSFSFFQPKESKCVVEKERLAVLSKYYTANLNQLETTIPYLNTESHLPTLKR